MNKVVPVLLSLGLLCGMASSCAAMETLDTYIARVENTPQNTEAWNLLSAHITNIAKHGDQETPNQLHNLLNAPRIKTLLRSHKTHDIKRVLVNVNHFAHHTKRYFKEDAALQKYFKFYKRAYRAMDNPGYTINNIGEALADTLDHHTDGYEADTDDEADTARKRSHSTPPRMQTVTVPTLPASHASPSNPMHENSQNRHVPHFFASWTQWITPAISAVCLSTAAYCAYHYGRFSFNAATWWPRRWA
jgi:hypothetical protein